MRLCQRKHEMEYDDHLNRWWCRTCHNNRRRGIRFQRHYQKVFIQTNGQGPWLCDYCNQEVENEESVLVIHHRDHNKTNNEPSNLGPMHRACHIKHHLHEVH